MPTIRYPVSGPHTLNEPEVASEKTFSSSRFNHFGSDIIALNSCDSYNFHVSKSYIVNSSPVLQELIIRSVLTTSVGTPGGEVQEILPAVRLPESGETLHSLLTFIFPGASILPPTSEKIMELLTVAQKYQMDLVLDLIRRSIARQAPPFIRPETAFHIYFLARKHELHHEALQAAQFTLRLPTDVDDLGDRLDFSDMTGTYLYELWKYQERVRTDIKSSHLEFRESDLPECVKDLPCRKSPGFLKLCPEWLDNYIKSIADAPHLFNFISFKDAWAHHTGVQNHGKNNYISHPICPCMDTEFSQVISTFWDALTAFIHDTIELVRRITVTVSLR